jgi:hypothetical protein
MKVKEYAQQHGVSPQAVYQRINGIKSRSNKPLKYYIEPKSKELTGEAIELLDGLYNGDNRIKELPVKTLEDDMNNLKQALNAVEIENKSLRDQLKEKDDIIADLRSDKRFLQTMLDSLTRQQQPKQGFFKRLFAGKGDQGNNQSAAEGKETEKKEAENTGKNA